MTSFSYDTAGNLLASTGALGQVTIFEYNSFGNRTSVINSLGNVTDWTHDARGNRLTETRTRTLPDTSIESLVTTFTYDDLDRVTTTAAADGSSTSTTYDLLGKVTSRTDALGADALVYQRDFAYDLVGNRSRQTIEEGAGPTVINSTYDGRDRVLTAASTSYGWDTNGNLISRDGASYVSLS